MGEHIAHARPPKGRGRRIFWNTVGVIGELLITASFVIGLFAVWQLYWTTFQVQGQVAQTITAYEEDHAPVARQAGEARTDAQPAFTLRTEQHTSELQSHQEISYAVFLL